MLAVCGFLLLAVALVFAQTVCHQFINLDDGIYVYENCQVSHGFTTHGLAWAFAGNDSALWVPVTWLSLMLDGRLYGLNAGGYHLSNVVLHAATAVLLFLVLCSMTARTWPSALVAAIFAVHPLHVESVAWVTERKDVLSGLLFMLTLAAYVSYVRHRFSLVRYLAVATLLALGLMAKPILVTAPPLLLLLDYWPLGRMSFSERVPNAVERRTASLLSLVIEKIPLLVLAAGFGLVTVLVQGDTLVSAEECPLRWRIGHTLISYVGYLAESFYPVNLAAAHPHPDLDLPLWEILAALSILVGITVAVLLGRRRCPYALVGWLWYLGMLAPVIGLVQVGEQTMADRFTYLPQIGVCMALAWAMADVCRSWPGHRLTCGVASAVMLAVLTGCAWRQTSFWRDGETLWNQALACTPRNEAAHNLLGLALVTQSRFDEAIAHYQQALEILPRYSVTHINLGTALQSCGRTKDAIAQYEQALAIKPNSVRVHHNLAVILADQGRFDEAVAHYQRAVEIKPDFAEAHNGLGTVLGRRGKFDEAITHFQRALAIRPDFALAHANLGTALQLQGKIDQAIAQFQQALEIEPDKLKNHKNLANALACRGRFGEAISHIRQVLNLEPDDADAHRSLAWLLATCPEASLRNGDEAIEHARRASQRYGDQPVFIDALAAAYAEAGRFPEALATERKALDLASRQNNQPLADALRARIALYKAGKPYRETPPVTARKATNIQPSTKASSQP